MSDSPILSQRAVLLLFGVHFFIQGQVSRSTFTRRFGHKNNPLGDSTNFSTAALDLVRAHAARAATTPDLRRRRFGTNMCDSIRWPT